MICPCKGCIVLPICRSKKSIECDALAEYYQEVVDHDKNTKLFKSEIEENLKIDYYVAVIDQNEDKMIRIYRAKDPKL